MSAQAWPELPLEKWKDTYATLHMWTQMVGKVRLALGAPINHYWGATLYVSPRGLRTSAIPYPGGVFEIEFDFLGHALRITTSGGEERSFRLKPQTVAEFFEHFMAALHSLGIDAHVWAMPVEVPRPVKFTVDTEHKAYDPEYVEKFFQVLVSASKVFWEFRSRFIGKSSPVHFFWGSFDLAVTRFSGRRAPKREGADKVTAEAYSHEVMSVGFWPGDGEVIKDAAFYAYAAPEPEGFREAKVGPAGAFYSREKNEYFLMYEDVRKAANPEQALMDFCQSTYEAGANFGNWNRAELERAAEK